MKKALRIVKRVILGIIALVLAIVIPIFLDQLIVNIRSSTLSLQQQQLEDIERLDYLIKNEFPHYRLFDTHGDFDNIINGVKESLSSSAMDEAEFKLEIIKAVAALKDAHTGVGNFSKLFDYTFQYNASWFQDGFYLTSGQFDPQWLGAKVIKFGNTDAQEVFTKLEAYSFSANRTGRAYYMTLYEASPALLHYEGIVDNKDEIYLTVATNEGDTTTLTFDKTPVAEAAARSGWSSIVEKYADQQPLWKAHPGKNYWYQYLEDRQILYFRYAQCIDQGDLSAFWDELFTTIEQVKPQKLVVDIRRNGGGDSQNHLKFLRRLVADSTMNQKGKLFTLIDRGTGSAAIDFASDMERLTHTILVGEKTLDKANTTSDPTYFSLPHSGITLVLPSLYSIHSYIADQRDAVNPHHLINPGVESYYSQNELLDFVENYQLPAPIIDYETVGLTSEFEGQYSFSSIRNMRLRKEGADWILSIDDLTESRLFQQDSLLISECYDLQLKVKDSVKMVFSLKIHETEIESMKLPPGTNSLMANIMNQRFEEAETQLNKLAINGKLPYYLDRPFFQTTTYLLYDKHGFEAAQSFNRITKSFYPKDPVLSIVDYELYDRESSFIGKTKSVFPIAGKLLQRYFEVVTTEKVMNDDYNAFIGR